MKKQKTTKPADASVAGAAHFKKTLGNLPEPIRALIQYSPEFFAGYLQLREAIYRPPEAGGHLDVKTKEMLYTLLDIVTGNLDGAKNHGHAAFVAGMTSLELAEACMIAIHVCGITPWGTVGYKVVDYIAELEQAKKTGKQAKKPKKAK